nr:MAG TPA: hypothetical protein [Caudoviricetes sp.]
MLMDITQLSHLFHYFFCRENRFTINISFI